MNEQHVQDHVADNYESLRHKLPYAKAYHDWWLRLMVDMSQPGKLILDNGCGIGPMFEFLEGESCIIGSDLSLEMLRKAKRHGHSVDSVSVVQANSQLLPFPEKTFDVLFARALIHHLPDPEQGIKEIKRVLKPGGQVIFADTNRSLLSTIPRMVAYRRDNFSDDHANLHRKQYLDWISGHLEIEATRFFGYLAYPFGFPDMMGPFRRVPFPTLLINVLIQMDNVLARIPWLKSQSWGLIVAARRGVDG